MWHCVVVLSRLKYKLFSSGMPALFLKTFSAQALVHSMIRLSCFHRPLQTIAAYLRFHLGRLDKLQGKVMTQKLEWWIILMVDCVTHFWLYCPPFNFSVPMRLQNIQSVSITRLIYDEVTTQLPCCSSSCWYCYKNKAHPI